MLDKARNNNIYNESAQPIKISTTKPPISPPPTTKPQK